MGVRRWLITILLIATPLFAFGAGVTNLSGPYTLNCVSLNQGFEIVLTKVTTNQSSAVQLPIGRCIT